MGVGTNAARIGGLAVALGIGAAVVAGNGVARADTSGESGSESSSTSSTSTDSSTSTGPRSGAKSPSTRPHTGGSSTTSVDSSTGSSQSTGSSSETSSGSTRPDEEKEEEQSETPQAETPKAPKVSNADNAEPDNRRHFEKKRSKDAHPSGSAADPVAGSTRSLDALDGTPAVRAPATASTKTVDDAPAVTNAPPTPTEDVPVATAPAVRQTIDVQQPEVGDGHAAACSGRGGDDCVIECGERALQPVRRRRADRADGVTGDVDVGGGGAAGVLDLGAEPPPADRSGDQQPHHRRHAGSGRRAHRCRHRPDAAAGMVAATADRRTAHRDPDCRVDQPDSDHQRCSASPHRLPGAAGSAGRHPAAARREGDLV